MAAAIAGLLVGVKLSFLSTLPIQTAFKKFLGCHSANACGQLYI
jgi:hypothetical protein